MTAQKRAQNVMEVPLSVSAIGGDEAASQKIDYTNDLAGVVPNLQVNQVGGDGTPVFALRGVTMNDYSVHQSSPVAVYTDEVYAGPMVLQPIQMFDLERIEVLRGPQGTLYGRNSTGGAVNLVTKAPGFEREAYLTTGIGNYDRREARGALQTTVVEDVLALRAAAMWTRAHGWFENETPGVSDNNEIDEWGLRVSALWRPSDAIEVIPRVSFGRTSPTNYGLYADNIEEIGVGLGADVYDLYNGLPGAAANPPDYTRAGLNRFEWEGDRDTERKHDIDQLSLHVNWDATKSLRVSSVSSWTRGDFLNPEDTDAAPLRMGEIDYFGDGYQWAQDLRLTSNLGGPFEFVAGLYYAEEKLDIATDFGLFQDIDFNLNGTIEPTDCADPLLTVTDPASVSADGQAAEVVLNGLGLSLGDFAGLGCEYRNSFHQDRLSLAAYYDGTFELREGTALLTGLRVTRDETDVHDFRTFVEGSGLELFDSIPSRDDSIEDNELTWKIGVEQLFGDDLLGYLTYNRGYRSGAFNGQAFFDPSEFTEVDPETIDAFELGAKSTLADGHVQLSAAVFYYIYKDQQLINVDPNVGTQTLVNIDESHILGFELEAVALPTETLRLSAGIGGLDGEAEEGVVSGVDVEGETLPNAPSWNARFAADWDFLEVEPGMLSLHLDTGYVSDQYFNLPHIHRVRVDGYWLVNARLALSAREDRWEVALWSRNLGDKWYATSTFALDGFGFDQLHIGPPRTFGAEFTYRFW